jgi:hypothetical protein
MHAIEFPSATVRVVHPDIATDAHRARFVAREAVQQTGYYFLITALLDSFSPICSKS